MAPSGASQILESDGEAGGTLDQILPCVNSDLKDIELVAIGFTLESLLRPGLNPAQGEAVIHANGMVSSSGKSRNGRPG